MNIDKRQIAEYIFDKELSLGKMIFLSGPRQIGKTTLTKSLLGKNADSGYFNWDKPETRKEYNINSMFFLDHIKPTENKLIVFDEIHKRTKWKNILKGIYDTIDKSYKIMVTGSARLELFRKSGDSLVGRYTHFHMLPISLSEMLNKSVNDLWLCNTTDWKNPFKALLLKLQNNLPKSGDEKALEHLFKFGGFPEPLLKSSDRFLLKWKNDYISLILREDMRELTNIKEIDNAEKIIDLLPGRVGSPLSIASLSREVETSFPTVKNNIIQLHKLWLLFSLKPWHKKMNRAIRKEEKCYFINWIYASDEAKKFENMLAMFLVKACTVWTDLAYGEAELHYVKNMDGNEIDFLITLNKIPALLLEAKLSDINIAKTAVNFSDRLGIPYIQLVNKSGIFKIQSPNRIVISADRFFSVLP